MMWLWQLRDVAVLGMGMLISVLALAQLRFMLPMAVTAVYGFLTIRIDDTSLLEYIRYSSKYLIFSQQYYEWEGYHEPVGQVAPQKPADELHKGADRHQGIFRIRN